MNFYKKELLDHYKNPRNNKKIENPSVSSQEYIPSCGDSIEMQFIIENNVLLKIAFTGKGCIISQATASMLTQNCIQRSITDLLKYDKTYILNMIGIELGPNRLKCALLPLFALHKGLEQYKS